MLSLLDEGVACCSVAAQAMTTMEAGMYPAVGFQASQEYVALHEYQASAGLTAGEGLRGHALV